MIEPAFYALVVLAALTAVVNWRAAVLLCLVIDAVRDPARKLVPGQPVVMTVVVAGVWLAVFASACAQERQRMAALVRAYPRLRTAFVLLIAALVPAGLISAVTIDGGWQLAAIGAASYLFPAMGVLLGCALVRREDDVDRFLRWYCLLNGLALCGAMFEYLRWNVPALGGLRVIWVRHHTDYAVDLISGFYRSPDVMGLHAATVMMFGTVLAARRRAGNARWSWLALVAFAGLCLLVCGRRKMIVMPFVFAGVLVVSVMRRRGRVPRWSIVATVLAAGVGAGLLIQQVEVSEDYATYARTTLDEGFGRIEKGVIGSALWTPTQSGIFGYGLGTATQGLQHLDVKDRPFTWQEDGAGRLVVELGVPGALLVLVAGFLVAGSGLAVLRSLPAGHPRFVVAAGLAGFLAANLASFVVSHQAYSGDPSSIMIVAVCLGMFFAVGRAAPVPGRVPASVSANVLPPTCPTRNGPRATPLRTAVHLPRTV